MRLPAGDRRELLLRGAAESGRDPGLLEKDIWVVWVLGWIGESRWSGDLVFKGGTSLSKVHHAIERFSEDVDLTYDIRCLVGDAGGLAADPVPASRSQADRWSEEARDALPVWVENEIFPSLREAAMNFGATPERDGPDVLIHYPSVLDETPGYLRTAVKLEFGGRATGEPADWADISCDIASYAPDDIQLPKARVRTMSAARTFWEKVTAMHVHCRQTKAPAERFARHWFDVACLHRADLAATALADRELASRVVEHKRKFFRPSKFHGEVEITECIQGQLKILPEGPTAEALREDYEAMLAAGYLGDWRPGWDEVLAHIAEVERQANEMN